MIRGVATKDVSGVWAAMSNKLQKALNYSDGKYTLDSILESLLNQEMQLWVTEGSVCVTEIRYFPNKKVMTILFAAGNLIDAKTIKFLEEWASSLGCQSVEIWGRPGWQKVLPEYETIHTVIRREL